MIPRKLSVLFAFFPYAGNSSGSSMVYEVTDWFTGLLVRLKTEKEFTDRISQVGVKSFNDTPITMTRNEAVKVCQEAGIDILVMVDSDMHPDLHRGDHGVTPFFDTAFNEIYEHYDKGPLCIGAPYGGKPPYENMFVFKWSGSMNGGPETPFSLEQYSREEAMMLNGIQDAAALPTGLIMYDMRCFDLIDPPYFRYEWTDKTESGKASTEDVVNTRDISLAGIDALGYNPVKCAWDSWAGHMKVWTVGKPNILTAECVAGSLRKAFNRGHKFMEEREVDFESDLAKRLVKSEDADHKTPEAHLRAVSDLVKERAGDKLNLYVTEVGCWTGAMTKCILDAADNVIVTVVDTFKGTDGDWTSKLASNRDILKEFEHRIGPEGLRRTHVRAGESREIAMHMVDESSDIVIIDADHSYEATLGDIQAWWPNVKPGGVMIGHDYMTQQFPGVDQAVDEFFGDKARPYAVSPEHGGFWMVEKDG